MTVRPAPRPAPAAPGVRALDDDDLGSLVVATVVSELRWTPDVAPLVVDRLARDAVAYPEHLGPPEPSAPTRRRGPVVHPRRGRRLRLLATGVLVALLAAALVLVVGADRVVTAAEPGEPSIRLEPFATGLVSPVHVTAGGDGSGSLYAVEQGGRIRVVTPDGEVLDEPFLDLTDAISVGYERGLLGLAFHPGFASNGRLFVNYTAREDGATVISEFVARDGLADRSSERVLLTIPQPYENHNGGSLAFDSAGHLLVGMGDGGSGGDPLGSGQDPTSLLGKLLRLDVDRGDPYGIPTDNGFDDPAFRPEIHASGLRNPWRFSVDPMGGHIYIGDVGQSDVEEVSVLVGGAGGVSLGWNRLEGDRCYSEPCDPAAHLAPVITYGHDEGCTIVGGHVYRGSAQPALEGTYLFGDYCSGTIWAASADRMLEGPVTPVPVAALDGTLVAFGVDEAGEIIVVDQGGRLLRVVADAPVPGLGGGSMSDGSSLLATRRPDPLTPGGPNAEGEATTEPDGEAEVEASPATTVDPASVSIRTVLVVDGLDGPVTVTGDGTGSGLLYIVERPGRVLVYDGRGIRPDPLLDISDRVGTSGELGLHAVAFHPDYARNGRFFVHYNDLEGTTRVEEYRTRRGRPVAVGRARPVLSVEQPFINNNGGPLLFGPDGYLYLALGDGGGSSPGDPMGFGQRKDSLLAKVLRLDVDRGRGYTVPRDNPYAPKKQRRGFAPETWAWGLREPRGVSIDPVTGDLWIGDAGQDRFEEIDLAPAGDGGLNFGWSDMEGASCHTEVDCDPTAYTLPVHTYDQVTPECGVVGGHVYRGSAIPGLVGAYLFTDLCSGVIRALDASAAREGLPVTVVELLDAPQGWRGFGRDEDGELYLTSLAGGVYRIEAESAP